MGQFKWSNIFKILKEKKSPTWILYPAKIMFNNEGKIKSFSILGKFENPHEHTHTIRKVKKRNFKASFSGRKKMITNRNINHKGTKSTGNSNYRGKYISFFLLFKYL